MENNEVFIPTGTEEEMKKLDELTCKKELTEADLVLILKCLTLSPDINNVILPEFISGKLKKEIVAAIQSKRPIIISGTQGATGKTTVVNILRKNSIPAFEKWECIEIIF